MATKNGPATRWDVVFEQLVAEQRRRVIGLLLTTPDGERLSVAEVARSAATVPEEQFEITLRHSHLPLLAEAGYIEWDSETGWIERGPRFDELAVVMESLLDAHAELPESLRNQNLFATHET